MAPRTRDLLILLNGYWELRCPRDERELIIVASHWTLDAGVASRVMSLGEWSLDCLGVRAWLISGGRTCQEQMKLQAKPGSMATDCARSTHVIDFPGQRWATGADLGFDRTLSVSEKQQLGREAERLGLRWGGGSSKDRNGIPLDWNHFDDGPRRN